MSNIKSLDQSTIHRICSGQVIINLANAVKELIENSLDAGSKTIEIRLKNYGSELIEVIDDGPGIQESDFQTITLKHYTSKIQKYEDLETLNTFGFRGEALSSLCALSNLTITTRHANSQCAFRLEYDKSGIIKSKAQCARAPGTTVTLEKLFHTLPVRHKEFTKNLKREYHKLMHLIQCYCLISDGVKLSCFHTQGDKSTKLMSTHSKNSLKENVIEIFGLSSFQSLVKFEQIDPDEEILAEFKVVNQLARQDNEESPADATEDNRNGSSLDEMRKKNNLFQLEGFISSCSHGQGRSAPDRQYIYVNKRPCDNSKIVKLVNEIFHQFNRTQYPMFILNISLDGQNVDVNVTPDKLQMFIKSENYLLAIIKASLLKIYNKLFKHLNLSQSSFHNSEKSASLMMSFCSPTLNSTKINNSGNQSKLSEFSSIGSSIDDEEDERTMSSSDKSYKTNETIDSRYDFSNEQKVLVLLIYYITKLYNPISLNLIYMIYLCECTKIVIWRAAIIQISLKFITDDVIFYSNHAQYLIV
jgi:DNA mismatch repair protein PMS2